LNNYVHPQQIQTLQTNNNSTLYSRDNLLKLMMFSRISEVEH